MYINSTVIFIRKGGNRGRMNGGKQDSGFWMWKETG